MSIVRSDLLELRETTLERREKAMADYNTYNGALQILDHLIELGDSRCAAAETLVDSDTSEEGGRG